MLGDDDELAGEYHGADSLDGGSGDDQMSGGGGADVLLGGAGHDVLLGDNGTTQLDAQWQGNDVLDGGEGDDQLVGNGGNDTLDGGAGNDALSGGDGDDRLTGGGGSDLLAGGAGSDTYVITEGDSVVQDTEGVNTLAWQDDSTNLESLTVQLVEFGADGSAAEALALQSSTNGLASLDAQPLAGQYVRIQSANGSVLVQGGLDAHFSEIVDAAGQRLSWEQLLAQAMSAQASPHNATGSRRWYGTGGDDALASETAGYKFVGGQGNDTITATGSGNTFFYSVGDGTDTISIVGADSNGGNTLRFGLGITPADIKLGLGSLLIRVGDNPADAIHIEDFNPDDVLARHPVDRFEFADGTVLTYEELLQRGFDLEGSEEDDAIGGTNVADRLTGGQGNDALQGGAGDDIYIYRLGDGNDQVLDTDTTTGNQDRLRLEAGILSDEVTVTRNYRDVTLTFSDGGTITLAGQLEGRGIERVEFADGTAWSADELVARAVFVPPEPQYIVGTWGDDLLAAGDGDDEVFGLFGNDVIHAGYGNDYLYGAYDWDEWSAGFADDDEIHGEAGNDWLDGGYFADHDTLYGGSGDDSYVFRRGSGDDVVVESGDVHNADRVVLENLWRDEVTFARVGNDLLVRIADTDDRLTIRDFFADDTAVVESFKFRYGSLTAQELRASLLIGTADDDNIVGYASDDSLYGGAGNDRLDGGDGSDTYTFGLGDGRDTIADSGAHGEDAIRFGAGIAPADVAVTRSESDLLLVVRATGERMIIQGWFGNAGPTIESVVFEDGTVWSPTELTAWALTPVAPSGDDDFIVGSDAGDAIDALAGNDEIHAIAGDDQLIGGTGDDLLSGGSGNDTYVYAQGHGSDVIADEGTGDTDILALGDGIDPDQLRVTRDASHLYLRLPDGETITVENWFVDAANRLAAVQFADGTTWNAEDLEALANTPTDGDDFLVGGTTDDFIDGLSGDDAIQGLEGNDTLRGGTGSDRLDGGKGDDVYVFNAGDGSDSIVDAEGYDRIQFGDGIAPGEIQVFADTSGAIVLQRYGTGDRIRIAAKVSNQWGEISLRPVIESVKFADGTIWTADDVANYAMTEPTTDSDELEGTDRSEIIDGLGGDDYAAGGQGDDRYVFKRGYGYLTIDDGDWTGGNSDSLVFGEGISPDDLVVRSEGYGNLILEIPGTDDRVRINSQFGGGNAGIERFVFANGTEWNMSDVELRLVVPEGTAGWDYIRGSGRNDSISGFAGNDWLQGAGGDDVVDGGTGADQIYGGDGNDTLISGASTASDLERERNYDRGSWYYNEHDWLAGGAGGDTYIINADSGYDQISDAEGANRIVLGQGLSAENVIISAGSGWEHSGQTRIDFGSGAVYVDAGSRIDRIESSDGVVITAADFDAYRLAWTYGTAGADALTGDISPDVMYGAAGNDVIHGGANRDALQGGAGIDRLFGDSGDDTINDWEGENFTDGGAGNDSLSGRGYLAGGAGDDTLDGEGILDGGIGNDHIHAGSGTVVLFGKGSGNDVIENASYARGFVVRTDLQPSEVEIVGGELDGLEVPLVLRIVATGESLSNVNGAASIVFADGSAWSAADIAAHAQLPVPIGTDGNDTLLGSSADDALAAGAGDDHLAGGAGADTLDGANGNDSLYGGGGNDILLGGEGSDQLLGGDGHDQLFGGAGSDTLTGGGGNDVLDGGAGNDSYCASAGVDTIRFGRGSGYDTFSAGTDGAQSPLTIVEMGADILPEDITVARYGSSLRFIVNDSGDGLAISDWLDQAQPASALEVRFADGTVWNTEAVLSKLPAGSGDFRDNTLTGSDGSDIIEGYGGNDNISGGTGNDSLYGGVGGDTLLGGDGNDTLYGGLGEDTLDGGAGKDVIHAGDGNSASEASADTIVLGFGSGEDTLASSDGRDVVQLGDGVRMQDVEIRVSGSELQIRLAGGTDILRISGWTYSSERVTTLRFADGSEIDLREPPFGVVIGSDAADSISDSVASPFNDHMYGQGGNDTLYGGAGDDVIHGGSGNDVIGGNSGGNVLDGGAGDDTYFLASDDDTLIFGFDSGQDNFYGSYYYSTTQPQTIRFEANVQPSDVLLKDVWFNASGGSLKLGLRGSTASLGSFQINVDEDGNPAISSRLVFGDGTVIEGKDVLQTLYRQTGTASNDDLAGTSGDDVIDAGAGSDVVLAGTGNDRVLGGAGDDTLIGGAGHDIYRFEAGFGRDTIRLQGNAESLDVVEFGDGILPEDMTVSTLIESNTGKRYLVLGVAGSSSQVRIENGWESGWGSSGSSLNLAEIRFEDGTVWKSADVASRLQVATSGNDNLQGSTGSDYFAAQAGDDSINGAEGDDVLLGGSGHDILDGGAGSDRLQGDDGDDQLAGAQGSDLLIGGHGNDMLIGGDGNDVYRFSRGDGHDVVGDFGRGPKDIDTIEFGPGITLDDITREVVDGSLVLHVAGGDDSITITGFDRPLMAIERIRFFDGTIIDPVTWAERDNLIVLNAGDGLRVVAGDSRHDSLEVGAGIDPDAVTVSREGADLVLRSGADGVRFAGWFSDSVSQPVLQARFADGTVWSAADLSRQASSLTGSAGADRLEVNGPFPAVISGAGGDDTLIGGFGDDVLLGGDGNDVLIGGMGSDLLEGGAGDDLYIVDDLNEVVELAGGGSDTVRLTATQDVVVSGEIENFEVLGTAAVKLTGNAADNRLVGNSAINRIEGGAGNDVLDGGAGADVLIGGSGDDRYVVDNAADTITELAGQGNDTVAASISWALTGGSNIENIQLLGEGDLIATGDAGANVLVGNGGRNVIRGLGGNDTLDGGGNADVLYGGQGDDRYLVDDSGDQVKELDGEGRDSVVATASFVLADFVEDLSLGGTANLDATGNAADNHIAGNAGNNTLSGGAGNDLLDGAAGNDVLFGGAGNDSYVFGRGYGQDVIVENGAASANDRLLLGAGLAPSDLLLRRNGDDLLVSVRGTSDRLTVRGYWQAANTVESIQFADGTMWGQLQVEAAIAATPPNTDPVVANAAADQIADVGHQFEFSVAGVFSDPDAGDVPIPKVMLASGDPLPRWLTFDAATRTFRGTPGEGDVGTISIVMQASDSANRVVSDQFDLSIRNSNDTSPIISRPLADQHGRQDELLSFSLPEDSFRDFDVGDHLSYSATLAGGQSLPSWLSFDPAQRSFIGTPGKDDVGTLSVSVTARDSRGRTATDLFDIFVEDVNDAPRVQRLIADQVLWQGQSIEVGLPADLFVDREGDAVSIRVTLANGDPLPAWLSYDPDTSRIVGTTNSGSVGITTLRITGTDSHGLATHTDFDVVVGDVNDAPIVTGSVGNLTAQEGQGAALQLPNGLFSDPDRGDTLTYSLEIVSRPSHAKSGFLLDSSNGTMTLRSTPPSSYSSPFVYSNLDYWDIGTWTFKLTAKDRLGLKTSTEFTVDVQSAGLNHIPVVATNPSQPWEVYGQVWDSTRNAWQWSYAKQESIVATMGESMQVQMPSFVDVDGDPLSISILPQGSSTADGWVYNPAQGTLQYQGADPLPRNQILDIIADDGHGGRSLTKIDVLANRKPVIEDIPEIVLREHQAFSVVLPDSTFHDPDGDVVYTSGNYVQIYNPLTTQYEILANYDAASKTIFGQAGDFGVGTYYLTLTAWDPYSWRYGTEPDGDAKGRVPNPSKQVKITVINEYDAPRLVAPLSDLTVQEDQSLFLSTSGAFYEVDRDQTLHYSATLSNGQALPSWLNFDSATGLLSGVPSTDQVGNYSIRITATDLAGTSISDDFNLAVTLGQRNHAPRLTIPVADQIYRRDQSFSFQLPRSTFSDVDPGDSLHYRALQDNGNPLPSWIQFDATTLTFSGHVPAGQRAPTEIRIVAIDSKGAEASDVFSLGIDEKTLPPVVATPVADQVAIEDAPFSLTLPAGEFSDPESSGTLTLSATLLDGSPLPAWLVFDAATATFSGTPGNGDVGVLQVRVTATEPDGGTAADIFQLTVQNVNDAPSAAGESFTMDEGAALDLAASALLANDHDIDPTHDTLVVSAVSDAVHGTVELMPGGHVRFIADDGYTGLAGFTYTISDGQGGYTNASVQIDVRQAVSGPVALDGEIGIEEDASRVLTASDFGFTDSDGPDDLQSIVIVATASAGRLVVDGQIVADGTSVLRSQLDAGLLVFTPAQNANGSAYADIEFRVDNGLASANTGVLTLNVTPVNDAPLPLSDDGLINEDAAAPLTGNVLANDSDVDAGTVLQVGNPGSRAGSYGTLNLSANGQYSYTLSSGSAVQSLAAGEVVHDVFSYTASDGSANTGSSLGITVVGQNDAPIVVRQIAAQAARSGQAFSLQFASDTFTDIDHGDTLAYSAKLADGSTLPSWLTFNAATRTFCGTPAAGDTGNLIIRLTATDSAGAQVSQSFALTTAPDQAPVTAFDANAVSEDDVLFASGNVLANDSDPEGTPLSVANAGTRNGQWGRLTLGSDGSYQYVLDNTSSAVQSLAAGQTVYEHFAYQASDGINSSVGGLTMAVTGKNDVPLLRNPLADKTIAPGYSVGWGIPSGSFVDIDQGDELGYSAQLADGSALPSWLEFDAATQTFSGKAPKNTKGTLDIIVTANDGHGGQSTVSDTFRITFDKNGLKGNEGVGNGEDPPPPGHDSNQNDGSGASPGHPGSQGGHHDDEDDDRDKRSQGHDQDEGEDDDHDDRGFAYLDLSKVDLCGRENDQGQHARRSNGSDDFYKRWAEMDRALGQLLADDKRADWLDPKHGTDLDSLKGIGLAAGSVKLGAGGFDNLSLIASDTSLKNFKGLQEGVCRL
jgi:trimeric autotransporter adhesin